MRSERESRFSRRRNSSQQAQPTAQTRQRRALTRFSPSDGGTASASRAFVSSRHSLRPLPSASLIASFIFPPGSGTRTLSKSSPQNWLSASSEAAGAASQRSMNGASFSLAFVGFLFPPPLNSGVDNIAGKTSRDQSS